jgi:hypothetical protein
MTALNRLLHPDDFRRHWRWITWGNTSLSYRVRNPAEWAIQIEVACWGFALATGVLYTVVEAIKYGVR